MLSEVPEGWTLHRLAELGKIVTGKTPSTTVEDYWGGAIPFITPTDLRDSPVVPVTSRHVTEKGAKVGTLLPAGSVLYACIGTVGKSAISHVPSISNQQINAVIPNGKTDPSFLYYGLQNCTPLLQSMAGKTAVPIINKTDFGQFRIPLPPLPEQRKIAEILGSVDEAIRATEAVIEQTRRVKKGLLQELLTKGIGHTRFKKTPIGEIPEGWKVARLDDVSRVIDCKHRTPAYSDRGFPVVRPGDITGGPLNLETCLKVVQEEFDDLNEKHRPTVGDIVYSRNQNYGIAALIETDEEFAIGQDVCIIHPVKLEPSFLCFALWSETVWIQIRKIMAGSTFKRINLGEIRKFRVPVPPRAEPLAIAEKLRSFENALQTARQESMKLKVVKQGLLQDLLTGKVRVSV